jgi:branched-chain amino acid transport system permease protein
VGIRGRGIGFAAGLAAAVVAVQLAANAAHKLFYLTQLTMGAYALLVVLGLALLMGYAGQASMGQAGFFAIGGYAAAFLTTRDLAKYRQETLVGILDRAHLLVTRGDGMGGTLTHLHPWAAALVAVGLAAGVAWLVAGPVFRLRGHYLAMATLGFGIIVHRVFLGSPHFGGADGISDVPPLALFPGFAITGRASARVANYYAAWAAVLLTLWMLTNLIGSRVGRALRAIHGSENAAAAVGIPIAAYKTRVFVLAAALAALAGVLLTHYNGGIGPSEASVMKSVRYVAIVAVGGMANFHGTVVMGTLLTFLSLRGYFGTLDDLVFGGILLAMMLFAPEGIVGADLGSRFKAVFSRRRDDPDDRTAA